jgi:hypothetical protein
MWKAAVKTSTCQAASSKFTALTVPKFRAEPPRIEIIQEGPVISKGYASIPTKTPPGAPLASLTSIYHSKPAFVRAKSVRLNFFSPFSNRDRSARIPSLSRPPPTGALRFNLRAKPALTLGLVDACLFVGAPAGHMKYPVAAPVDVPLDQATI